MKTKEKLEQLGWEFINRIAISNYYLFELESDKDFIMTFKDSHRNIVLNYRNNNILTTWQNTDIHDFTIKELQLILDYIKEQGK